MSSDSEWDDPSCRRKQPGRNAGKRESASGRIAWRNVRARLVNQLPPGPASVEEIYMWPLTINQSCFTTGSSQDDIMKQRFLSHCNRTMIFYGDYSGAEFAQEAMQRLIERFEKMDGERFPQIPFRFVRSIFALVRNIKTRTGIRSCAHLCLCLCLYL